LANVDAVEIGRTKAPDGIPSPISIHQNSRKRTKKVEIRAASHLFI